MIDGTKVGVLTHTEYKNRERLLAYRMKRGIYVTTRMPKSFSVVVERFNNATKAMDDFGKAVGRVFKHED